MRKNFLNQFRIRLQKAHQYNTATVSKELVSYPILYNLASLLTLGIKPT